jgi:hypothetical protein
MLRFAQGGEGTIFFAYALISASFFQRRNGYNFLFFALLSFNPGIPTMLRFATLPPSKEN